MNTDLSDVSESINKPFSDEEIDNGDNIKQIPELDVKEFGDNNGTSFATDSQIISTAVTVTDNKIEPVSWSQAEVVSEEGLGVENPEDSIENSSILSVAAAVPRPKQNTCGVKGGKSVEQAYGKEASKYILPLLIDSWVFGKDRDQKARFEDTEARVVGGKVTSTVLYCWVAAILTVEGEFVCTGTLVTDDLVLTSGSCINL